MGRICVLAILFFSFSASAIELKFGPEFTVSSDEMLNCQKDNRPFQMGNVGYRGLYCKNQVIATKYHELEELWRSKHIAWAEKGQELEVSQIELPEEKRLFFLDKDGAGAWLGVDPGVLEMGHTPLIIPEIEKRQDLFQQMFFEDTKEIGLEPKWLTGGGHMNIGLEEFRGKPLLFINFMRDLYNHPELTMGVFGYDTNNALTLRQVQKNPYGFANNTEKLALKSGGMKWKFFLFRTLLEVAPPKQHDIFLSHWNDLRQNAKSERGGMYAVVFHKSEGEDTSADRIEIRAVRPQVSMNQWLRMIKLLQARITYLEQFDTVIPIEEDMIDINRAGTAASLVDNPPVNPQKALERFYQYVTESGESWLDHQDYLWPQWHIDGEIIEFNNNKMKNCEDFLAI